MTAASPGFSPEDGPSREASAGCVLIADDETGFIEATSWVLEDAGYECLRATDASTVLDAPELDRVDAILTDIRMPGNSELELLRQLRSRDCHAAIIVVTGHPTAATAIRSANLGVTAYLTKPVEPKELLGVLQRSVSDARALRKIRGVAAQLRDRASELDVLGRCLPGSTSAEAPLAAPSVLDLAFDSVIGVLLELKELVSGLPDGARGRVGDRTFAGLGHSRITGALLAEHPSLRELSRREREVLLSLADGNRVATIARSLFISPHTVRNHLKSVFAKLGVGSQVELLEWLKGQRSD